MSMQLIVNADDFGYSSDVNAAVIKAHREGVLTSASLMVTGNAVHEAVVLAEENPNLAVGLHLVLSHGKSVLPPDIISDLVNSRAMFPASPIAASLKYIMSPKARRQLRLEIEAQFELFTRLGLPLSHVDGHQHMHALPGVLSHVMELAESYGARGIRVPRDPLYWNLQVDSSSLFSKLAVGLAHSYQTNICGHALKNSSLARTDLCIGSLMTGHMSVDYVVGMLRRVRAASVEIYFHPCLEISDEPLGPNPGDLRTLLSPALKDYVTGNCCLTTYSKLRDSEVS